MFATTPDRPTTEPAEADDDVRRPLDLQFFHRLVQDAVDQRADVVGPVPLLRQLALEFGVVRHVREAGDTRPGEQRRHLPRPAQRVRLGVGDDVHHAGLSAVRHRPAEVLHVDLLAGDRLDHIRPGDEDPAVRRHDHDVGQRRAVGGAAGRSAEHHGDLRHPAGRPDHGGEDMADAVQRLDALGQPGTAGMPQPDDRRALPHGGLDGVDDVPAALMSHGAAHPGAVRAEGDDLGPVDPAANGQHTGGVGGMQRGHRIRVHQRGEPDLGFPWIDRPRAELRLRGRAAAEPRRRRLGRG